MVKRGVPSGRVFLVGILAVLLSGCTASRPPEGGQPSTRPWPPSVSGPSTVTVAPEPRRVADQLVSVFENGRVEVQYDYVEALSDGRGFTCGKIGFTTSGTEVRDVIAAYLARRPDTPLARHLPRLSELATTGSGDTDGLSGFAVDWAAAAGDPVFQQVQNAAADRLTFDPAVSAARRVGLRSALGVAILFDTAVQHGMGPDPDGLPALIDRATTAAGGQPATTGVAERQWLLGFLDARAATLRDAAAPATRQVWRESVDRVAALRRLVQADRHELTPPVDITVFGGRHVLR
ncbi:MAG TPA: chitosanase [Catenuloplanes sp.]|jgi:chitosanase